MASSRLEELTALIRSKETGDGRGTSTRRVRRVGARTVHGSDATVLVFRHGWNWVRERLQVRDTGETRVQEERGRGLVD